VLESKYYMTLPPLGAGVPQVSQGKLESSAAKMSRPGGAQASGQNTKLAAFMRDVPPARYVVQTGYLDQRCRI
jgi:hypothetical protein